nr:hypothetical protein [Microcystis aeruginosa SX13-01]
MSNDYSLLFDGTDDYVSIPHSSNLSLTNFTIETWVNPSQVKGDWQPLITKEASNGYQRNYGLFIVPNQMKVLAQFIDIYGVWQTIYSVSSFNLSQWNHISMTYDGSTFSFYINGILDSIVNVVTTPLQNTEPVKIGKEISAYTPFSGKMDEVRIWNKARTQAEIQADMNHQLTGTESGLIGYWQFSEGTGNIVTDLSWHNNNGIINGATYTEGFFGDSVLSFNQGTFSIKEDGIGTSIVAVTVIRTGGFNSEVSADVTLSFLTGDTASNDDFTTNSVIVNFAIGETSKTVTIPIKDDLLDDNNETVHLVLSNPSLGTIVDPNNNTAILTIIDNEGTAGNDNLVGTAGNDVINGFAGNDAISGLAGNDYLIGEAGNDVLYGGDGNDTLDGGTGDDYLLPGSGINTVIGGTGTDRLDLDYSTATTDVTVTYNDSNNGTISDGST